MSFQPSVGLTYNLICPSCFTPLQFACASLYQSRIKCSTCQCLIDLRSVVVVDDASTTAEDGVTESPIQYSSEVELNVGCTTSAVDQVAAVMKESEVHIPAVVSAEATNAVGEERAMEISQRLWFFHFITLTFEYLYFGRKPYCKLGHVRIFRKRIPFVGYRYIPVPRSSTSYSRLAAIIFYFFVCACYATWASGLESGFLRIAVLFVLMMILYLNIVLTTYSDPGFVLPGYISGDENGGNEVLDRDAVYRYKPDDQHFISSIENGKRESKWVNIGEVPMERKWCPQCKIYRPVRAAHCYQCGLCCATHDHHCVVTGACVGKRNILFFIYFVTEGYWAAFLSGYIPCLCLYRHPEAFSSFGYYWLLITNVLLAWLLSGLAASLSVGLTYGILVDTTTRERLTGVYSMKRNPFRKSIMKNLMNAWPGKRQEPSILREEVMALWASAAGADRV